MTETVQVAIISAVVSLVGLFLNYKINAIHKQIDGRMGELLEVTKSASKAEGKAAGKIEERKEVKERKK